MVRNASNRAPARASSCPFLMPDQPMHWTVETSCPTSNAPRRRGRSSSSRMRIRDQCSASLFENGDSRLPRDRRKVVEEDFQRVARLQVVEQGLHRHASTVLSNEV